MDYFEKHPRSLEIYSLAPVRRRIDPTYCPLPRRHTWSEFYDVTHAGRRKTWLNYPKLPSPTKHVTHDYFVHTLQAMKSQCHNIPDIACKMMETIVDMLVTVAQAFQREYLLPHQLSHPSIYYDLSQYPSTAQLMNIYARVIHLPSRYIMTFEEACFTGFFEYPGAVFSPYEVYVNTRYKRYQQHLQAPYTLPGDRQ